MSQTLFGIYKPCIEYKSKVTDEKTTVSVDTRSPKYLRNFLQFFAQVTARDLGPSFERGVQKSAMTRESVRCGTPFWGNKGGGWPWVILSDFPIRCQRIFISNVSLEKQFTYWISWQTFQQIKHIWGIEIDAMLALKFPYPFEFWIIEPGNGQHGYMVI